MSTMLARIKELAEKESITISGLEKKIGSSKGVLSRAIKYGTDIQAKWLLAIIESYPHYSAQWLLTGKEPVKAEQDTFSETTDPYPPFRSEQESPRICIQDQRIADLQETIASLKETNAVQKELITELRKTISRITPA